MTRQNNKHRKALEKIAANLSKFGFKHIVSISIEQTLLDNGRGPIAQPDLILESSRKEVHIVEYKSNGDKRLIERARKQLENAVWWIGKYRPHIVLENIYTHIISGTDPKYKNMFR